MKVAVGIVTAALAIASSGSVLAQQSASFKLEESSLNSGGHPGAGTNPTSASHRLTLGAIGDGPAAGLLSGPSFRLEGNFASAYAPPGETHDLEFSADKVTLTWSAEPSAGDYNLYRDGLTNLAGLGYGACLQQHITGPNTTDAALPLVGQGFFYLVTVENLLDEEGTKGFASNGVEHAGTQCP